MAVLLLLLELFHLIKQERAYPLGLWQQSGGGGQVKITSFTTTTTTFLGERRKSFEAVPDWAITPFHRSRKSEINRQEFVHSLTTEGADCCSVERETLPSQRINHRRTDIEWEDESVVRSRIFSWGISSPRKFFFPFLFYSSLHPNRRLRCANTNKKTLSSSSPLISSSFPRDNNLLPASLLLESVGPRAVMERRPQTPRV